MNTATTNAHKSYLTMQLTSETPDALAKALDEFLAQMNEQGVSPDRFCVWEGEPGETSMRLDLYPMNAKH